MPKRVYCLYRVSTKGQVEKNDIPMQKQRCHEFVAEKGWEIVKEFSEKGVSGFKVSAKDRDAIQEIQKDAALQQFDVLLVFMFDRLGRKEDETPFVVEWFVRNGIEVWSTEEGEQRFDNHTDKLMNYLRYWQASGESIKTSIRTKTRLAQIIQEGKFRGGIAPYGYKLVKNGRTGKKNRELFDLKINPDEAPAIKEIFELSDRFGYGGRRISTELKSKGILNLRTGEPFHYSSIRNILRNITYVGILRSGETKSDIFQELQIITLEQFERVEKACKQRSTTYDNRCAEAWGEEIVLADGTEKLVSRPPRNTPRRNYDKALLSGNVFFGHCGGRIFASTARKDHHPIKETEFIDLRVQATSAQYKQQLKTVKSDLSKSTKDLSKWENLMMDSIEGKCVFTPEQVKKQLDTVQNRIADLMEQIEHLQKAADESKALTEKIMEEHHQLLSWADIFADASPEEKKMVASQMIKAVTLTRNYGIQVEFNISEVQFLSGMEMS